MRAEQFNLSTITILLIVTLSSVTLHQVRGAPLTTTATSSSLIAAAVDTSKRQAPGWLVWAIDNLNGTQQIQQYDISNSVVSTLVDLKSFRPLEIKGITLDTDNTRAHLVMISGTSSFIVSANTSSGAVLNKTLLSNDYSNLMDLQYDKKQKVLFAFIQQNRFIPTLHYIAVGIIDLVTGSFHSLTKIQTHFNLFLSSTYNTDTGEYFFYHGINRR